MPRQSVLSQNSILSAVPSPANSILDSPKCHNGQSHPSIVKNSPKRRSNPTTTNKIVVTSLNLYPSLPPNSAPSRLGGPSVNCRYRKKMKYYPYLDRIRILKSLLLSH